MKPWRVLESRLVVDRPWLRVREEHVALPSGVEIEEFHVVEGVDWVAVLAITGDAEVVLVEQYRHGLGGTSRELPAGVIDPGETPLDAARRELLEETGFASDAWEPLVTVSTEPSRHTNRAHFFLARGARRIAEASPEAVEQIEVRLVPSVELLEGLDHGMVAHGVHIGAILLAARRGWLQPSGR